MIARNPRAAVRLLTAARYCPTLPRTAKGTREYLNWAHKFFIDARLRELEIRRTGAERISEGCGPSS
jgi:hypothetical protein